MSDIDPKRPDPTEYPVPELDDDTSAGGVTQGGRGDRKGHSLWWVIALVVMLVVAGVFWATMHKVAPAEHNTIPVSGTGGTGR